MVTFPEPTPDAVNDPGCAVRPYDQLDPTGHALTLDAYGTGKSATTVTFVASGHMPNSNMFFAIDFTPLHIPVATNLVALVGGMIIVSLPTDSSGTVTVPLFIPPQGSLPQTDLYFQTAGMDAAGVVSGSNGIHVAVCP